MQTHPLNAALHSTFALETLRRAAPPSAILDVGRIADQLTKPVFTHLVGPGMSVVGAVVGRVAGTLDQFGLGGGTTVSSGQSEQSADLQAALANAAAAQQALDAANAKVATETDPAQLADDIAAQMQAVTDLANAQAMVQQAAAAAGADAGGSVADQILKNQGGGGSVPVKPAPGPIAPAPAPAPAPAQTSGLKSALPWVLGGLALAAGGYYVATEL